MVNRWIPGLHYFSILFLFCPLWPPNPNLLLSSPGTINTKAVNTIWEDNSKLKVSNFQFTNKKYVLSTAASIAVKIDKFEQLPLSSSNAK